MITIATTFEATRQAEGEFRAGGTDVSARRRLGISRGPLVDILGMEGCQDVCQADNGSLILGSMVSLHAIANHPLIVERYPSLAQVVGRIATPQIRHMVTLGGSLLQRPQSRSAAEPACRYR